MGRQVITDEGIIIEAAGDTIFLRGIPDADGYRYGLFSLRRPYWKMEGEAFPDGVWKKVKGKEASYCLKDRGEGEHEVFISFVPVKKSYPDYTVKYVYKINIGEGDVVTIGDRVPWN